MKKIICLLLCVVLLGSLAGCGEKEGSGKNTITVSEAKGSKGDEVTVTITASDKTPVAAYELNLGFDHTKLELVEYDSSKDFSGKYQGLVLHSDTEGNIKFSGANATTSEEKYQGEMFYATFKIIGEEKETTDLDLIIKFLTTVDQTRYEEDFTAVSGKVTIE